MIFGPQGQDPSIAWSYRSINADHIPLFSFTLFFPFFFCFLCVITAHSYGVHGLGKGGTYVRSYIRLRGRGRCLVFYCCFAFFVLLVIWVTCMLQEWGWKTPKYKGNGCIWLMYVTLKAFIEVRVWSWGLPIRWLVGDNECVNSRNIQFQRGNLYAENSSYTIIKNFGR